MSAIVEVVPWNPSWARQFEAERAILEKALAEWVVGSIEHVGSTAVEGLAAKPVIDIMAGVRTLDDSRPAIATAEALGYSYAPYRTEVMHWFCKPSDAVRTHHLHLVPLGSEAWVRPLAFRDYLRTHPGVARDYEALKRDLAKKHRLDREAYTAAKGPFVVNLTDRAIAEGYGD